MRSRATNHGKAPVRIRRRTAFEIRRRAVPQALQKDQDHRPWNRASVLIDHLGIITDAPLQRFLIGATALTARGNYHGLGFLNRLAPDDQRLKPWKRSGGL